MVTTEAIIFVLLKEEEVRQLPIYYISNALMATETRHPDMDKLILALITTS